MVGKSNLKEKVPEWASSAWECVDPVPINNCFESLFGICFTADFRALVAAEVLPIGIRQLPISLRKLSNLSLINN